jgi:hypothetical protein
MPNNLMPEPATPLPKRIVFQHTKGKLAGLYAIMGLSSDFGTDALPQSAEGFEAHGHVIPYAGLVKVTPRYALYREPLNFGKKFDERQE